MTSDREDGDNPATSANDPGGPGDGLDGAGVAGRPRKMPDRDEGNGDMVVPATRMDKRRYFALMAVCIALFVVSWAVVGRYSVLAAVIMSAVALVIPPVAAIVGNATSAADRRRPLSGRTARRRVLTGPR